MTNEQKDKWLADLRSGNYAQCRDRLILYGDNGKRLAFCCLGVLMENKEFDDKLLSEIFDDSTARQLIRMNDLCEMTFTEIADWIETNIEVDK